MAPNSSEGKTTKFIVKKELILLRLVKTTRKYYQKAFSVQAHQMGLTVLLDVVHSHACKNVADGLNM